MITIQRVPLLDYLRIKYLILAKFDLQVPRPGQHPFDPVPKFFYLSCDTLKVGLCFPFHPLIMSCFQWWEILHF